MKETFYITTPIYYPSDKLHIGHTYTSVAADVLARYNRLKGKEVFFLTGTDEHGEKIFQLAKKKNVTPQEYVDDIVSGIKKLWKTMEITNDDFIRTTDKRHRDVVKKIFKKLYDQGDIYKGQYEGLYCTPCESFWTETQAEDKKCPDCGREIAVVSEDAYFFKLSTYADRILKHLENNPEFLQPSSRVNEMINNFIKPGLQDLCVSRTSFDWGVPVEFDPGHVVYVWIDALSNYISALGFWSEDSSLFDKFWPADVQLMGKEIVRFHSIIWPAMLMALDLPLPKKVFGHGWLLFDDAKMSKSVGNVVDPDLLVEKYGVDSVRYFLMRDMVFGMDGSFSEIALAKRINGDLANDLGNLLSRTIAMILQNFGENLPLPDGSLEDADFQLKQIVEENILQGEKFFEELHFSKALDSYWNIIRFANKYIDLTQPWLLAKDADKKGRLGTVLYHLAESLRVISVLIAPVMPHSSETIRETLGINKNIENYQNELQWGGLTASKVTRKDSLFPRIDLKVFEAPKEDKKEKKQKKVEENMVNLIGIEDFAKCQLKTGVIVEASKVEGADKLLKLLVDIGNEKRQIVAGIAAYYSTEELPGKKVVVVTNLKPANLRGVESQGMLLAASKGKKLSLITCDPDVEPGSVVR